MKKNILIVEDLTTVSHCLRLITKKCVPGCGVLIVTSVPEVISLMNEGRKFDLTYWDGELDDGDITTNDDLLKRASKVFGGYHIAMSSCLEIQKEQSRQGCGDLSLTKSNFDFEKVETLLKSLTNLFEE